MPGNRGIRRAKRLSSDRCTSPEDEHASSLKYIEAAYSGDIKPLRDLTQNFQVKLDVLIQYVERLKQSVSERINYFHAGLILQSSREVYSRKVDYLEMLLDALIRTASSVELIEKPEADVEQKKCSRRQRQLWPKLEEFKRVTKDEITLLPESQRVVNFDLPKTVRLPPILPMLLMPPMYNHVLLRDAKGDVMGRKGDFRVNWPVNHEGMPTDLAKQLRKNAREDDQKKQDCFTFAKPTLECNTDSEADDAPLDDNFSNADLESTMGEDFNKNTFLNDLCSTPAPHGDHVYEMDCFPGPSRPDTSVSMKEKGTPFVPLLEPNSRPKRTPKKLPAMMTMKEFFTGKKKNQTSATKRKRKAAKSTTESKTNKAKRLKTDTEIEEPLEVEDTADITQEKTENLIVSPNSPGASSISPPHATDWDLDAPDDLDDEVAGIMGVGEDSNLSEGFAELAVSTRLKEASTPQRQQEEADDRYQTWSERIKPILQKLDERPKFNLRDTARTIIQKMKLNELVPLESILGHEKPEQVSRNFVALLQLCNTRNVEIGDDSVVLLSDGFKLGAEVPGDDNLTELMSLTSLSSEAATSNTHPT